MKDSINFFKKLYLFFKKRLNKKDNIKMISAPIIKESKENFINSLKVQPNENKKKVESLTCVGDGLGIQSKITY